MKKNILTVLLLVLLSGATFSQRIKLPDLPGYKKNIDYPVFNSENLRDFINGASEKYVSNGFVDLNVGEYKKGKSLIRLEVYRHLNNSMAFGIYSSERSSSFSFKNIGAQGYVADGTINFFKGDYYIKIRASSKNEKSIQASESLALKVSDMLPGDSKMPAVLSQFPDIGKKINEETFINENVLGHNFLTNAYKAGYEIGSDAFSVYIIENNSTAETIITVEAYLKSAGLEEVGAGSGKYMLSDKYNGTIFLSWNENQIVIISGLSKDQSEIADRYTTEIIK